MGKDWYGWGANNDVAREKDGRKDRKKASTGYCPRPQRCTDRLDLLSGSSSRLHLHKPAQEELARLRSSGPLLPSHQHRNPLLRLLREPGPLPKKGSGSVRPDHHARPPASAPSPALLHKHSRHRTSLPRQRDTHRTLPGNGSRTAADLRPHFRHTDRKDHAEGRHTESCPRSSPVQTDAIGVGIGKGRRRRRSVRRGDGSGRRGPSWDRRGYGLLRRRNLRRRGRLCCSGGKRRKAYEKERVKVTEKASMYGSVIRGK
jgi:hypothetical protein